MILAVSAAQHMLSGSAVERASEDRSLAEDVAYGMQLRPGGVGVSRRGSAVAVLFASLAFAAPAAGQTPAETVAAREHFFGAENVDAAGQVRRDRVLLSWFSVASVAMAIDGRVVLLDTYIHKAEDKPNYVPTTTAELVALQPEAIFVGHGHFDHANTVGEIAVRTGALVVGAPEHCDQARAQAEAYAGRPVLVNCVEAVARAAEPGALSELQPLGDSIEVTVLKHVHSAAVPPDGEGHETSLAGGGLPDANQTLLHPPGPGTVEGSATSGDEGATLLYQFRVGRFSLTWHDSVGPLRELAPHVLDLLSKLPPTDVELGSTLGFNDPTNGQRDPVDYLVRLKPKVFFPLHHDFIAEYGVSRGLEGVFRRELAKRDPVPTEVRWLYDPYDYLRPSLLSFDVERELVATPGASCLRPRQGISSRGIGRIALGRTASALARRVVPVRRTRQRARWCVQGRRGAVTAVFGKRGRSRLVATTVRSHGSRGVRVGRSARRVRAAFRGARPILPGVLQAGPRSTKLIAVRGGRVRYVAVVQPFLLHHRTLLLRALGRLQPR